MSTSPESPQSVSVSGHPTRDADRLTCAAGVRREFTFCERVEAGLEQTRRQPWYEVPDSCPITGCTPDEQHFVPRYAASFHKLLYHDENNGLLTDDGTATSGVVNYQRMLCGLKIQTPSSNFDTAALNGLQLGTRHPVIDGKEVRPRVLINPRASKALSIKGPDIVALDVGKIIYGLGYTKNILDEISL